MLGIDNILCLTGDHTKLGDHPQAKPVFDLDSVSLLYAASLLETGKDLGGNELVGEPPKFAKDASIVAVLGTVNGEKVTLLAVCGKNAVASGIKAGDIIKTIAPIVGGKGGGKPDSAMGGGTDALKVDDALAAVDDYVAANVKD